MGSSKNIKEAIEIAQARGDGGRAGQVLTFQICVLPIFWCINGENSSMVIGQKWERDAVSGEKLASWSGVSMPNVGGPDPYFIMTLRKHNRQVVV